MTAFERHDQCMSAYTSRIDTALAYLAGGNSVLAERLFREVLAEAPDCGAAWHGLACVARHTGQPRIAIASVAQALTLAGNDQEKAQFHLTLAAALDEAGHMREAIAACRVVLLLEPREFRARMLLSELLYRKDQDDEAARLFQEALSLAAEPVPLLMHHGTFLMVQRRFARSIEIFEALVRFCPDDPQALANLGAALFENAEMERAYEVLTRATVLGTPSAQTLSNLGLVCQALGLFAEALAAFDHAISKMPHEGVIALNRATLLNEIGRIEEAEALFRSLSSQGGGLADQARFNLAMIDLASGRFASGWAGFEMRRAVLGLSAFTALGTEK